MTHTSFGSVTLSIHPLLTPVNSQRLGVHSRCSVSVIVIQHVVVFCCWQGSMLRRCVAVPQEMFWLNVELGVGSRGREACGKTTTRGSLGRAAVLHVPSCFHLPPKHTHTHNRKCMCTDVSVANTHACTYTQICDSWQFIWDLNLVIVYLKAILTTSNRRKTSSHTCLHWVWFRRPRIMAGTQAGPICTASLLLMTPLGTPYLMGQLSQHVQVYQHKHFIKNWSQRFFCLFVFFLLSQG